MSSSSRSEIMRLVRFIKPRRKSYLFGLFGFSIIDSSLPISMAISLKFVLDAVADKSMSGLWIITMILVAITAVYCILIPIFQYAFSKSVKWIMTDFRLAVFHHLEKLPVVYYEDTHSGDSLSRITNDLGVVENTFTDNIRSLISLVITGVISAVAMFYLDWRFAVVMIVMGLVSTYVNSRFAKPLRKVSDEIQLNSSKQLERLSDLIAGTQVSRMFQMIDTMNDKYRATNYLLAKLSINRTVKNAYLKSTNYF